MTWGELIRLLKRQGWCEERARIDVGLHVEGGTSVPPTAITHAPGLKTRPPSVTSARGYRPNQ